MYHFIISKTHLSSALLGKSNEIHSKLKDYHLTFVTESPLDSIKKIQSEHEEVVCIFDKKVYDLYFKGFKDTPYFCIEAAEERKSLETVVEICRFFSSHQLSKSGQVLVIGGGVIQEVCSFAAAMYKRGVQWHCMPTTLLSMADSCLGGKTSLNMDGNKNLLGLFYPPDSILINPNFLTTLSNEEYFSGMGEVLKHHIIAGEEAFGLYEAMAQKCAPSSDSSNILGLLQGGLAVKRTIIEHDEFEEDVRRALNYGHSIGHAIESISRYQIPHGLAITLGIVVENNIAFLRGFLDKQLKERIQASALLLLPSRILETFADLPLDQITNKLMLDKKVMNGVLPCSSLRDLGRLMFDELELLEAGVIIQAMILTQEWSKLIPN